MLRGKIMSTKKTIGIRCEASEINAVQAMEYVKNAIAAKLHRDCDVEVTPQQVTIWSPTGLQFSVPVGKELAQFFAAAKWAEETKQRFSHQAFTFSINVPDVGGYLK